MKSISRPAAAWLMVAGVVILCSILVLVMGLSANTSPDTALLTQTADSAMQLTSAGDYPALSQLLLDTPELGNAPAPSDTAQGIIWQAWQESLHYTLSDPELEETPIVRINVTCLDIGAVTTAMEAIAPELLQIKADEAETEIYDADHAYLPEFLAGVLKDAAVQALEAAPTMEREILLEFVRTQDGWFIRPTKSLLQMLSGFLV